MLFEEVIDYILGICPVGVFDAKVINEKAEVDGGKFCGEKGQEFDRWGCALR